MMYAALFYSPVLVLGAVLGGIFLACYRRKPGVALALVGLGGVIGTLGFYLYAWSFQ